MNELAFLGILSVVMQLNRPVRRVVILVEAEGKAGIGLGAFHPEDVMVVADLCLEPVYAALG